MGNAVYSSEVRSSVFQMSVLLNPRTYTISISHLRVQTERQTEPLMFIFLSSFPLSLVLQRGAHLLYQHRQDLVQGVHHSSLEPLGNCSSGMMEAELLQDVVHSHGIDLPPGPGNQPEGQKAAVFRKLRRRASSHFPKTSRMSTGMAGDKITNLKNKEPATAPQHHLLYILCN